jgi:hypothetical protein
MSQLWRNQKRYGGSNSFQYLLDSEPFDDSGLTYPLLLSATYVNQRLWLGRSDHSRSVADICRSVKGAFQVEHECAFNRHPGLQPSLQVTHATSRNAPFTVRP